MTPDEIRKIENFVLAKPLVEINHPENLAFLAGLIQDQDHFREKLMTEPDRRKRQAKYDVMAPNLTFKAAPLVDYELAEALRGQGCGVQPIYREQEEMEKKRIWMPPSIPEPY